MSFQSLLEAAALQTPVLMNSAQINFSYYNHCALSAHQHNDESQKFNFLQTDFYCKIRQNLNIDIHIITTVMNMQHCFLT